MVHKNGINIKDENLYDNIKTTLSRAREKAYKAVNFAIVDAYWNIGRMIVEEEQNGTDRANYGDYIIKYLSEKLTKDFGKGFSTTNLKYMRRFYNAFSISQTLSDQLSWSHYLLLSKIDETQKRKFYFEEAISANWSVRELDRQIASLLFERLSLSKDKKSILQLANEGHKISKPEDLVKDPYVLEFLGLKQNSAFYEKNLEDALIEHLQEFLLELGKGFCFVSRQQRITLDGEHYFIDLVFYNRIAKCFVLIDLKIGKLTHQDIGQMQMYTNYYKRNEMMDGENEPIGILLCSEKNEAVVKYTLPEGQKQIFASKYKIYLPSEEELKEELIKERDIIEIQKKIK
ncbi:PDDEXK nuclease domain-containing protein [Clostridium sediminicola]|uniref:PDDEXK nuclease domain-containing protein n=1 Tax=Clostridium sediminicola TaxID=3114879 RepID=UPI0031F23897